jgi:hypothetical protein
LLIKKQTKEIKLEKEEEKEVLAFVDQDASVIRWVIERERQPPPASKSLTVTVAARQKLSSRSPLFLQPPSIPLSFSLSDRGMNNPES